MRPGCALVAALLVAAILSPAIADEAPGIDRVRAYLENVQTLRAEFTQDVIDRDFEIIESATGQLALSRPGRFRWDYLQPFERVIVADGERLWLYEADLDQVTVRPMDAGLGATPAALLTGGVDILEGFEHLGSETIDDRLWVTLGPRSDTADFASIRLGFDDQELTELVLSDRLGQTTRVRFAAIERDPELAPDLFSFTVPPNADVIGEEDL
ncbi:MAG: outer membrane lipoprotein chaperone LolA [Gammaproteobacteria bacterium]|nr:outer membrane lipoprotein chaperone LolA [Gammaproteobacteria bacterium]